MPLPDIEILTSYVSQIFRVNDVTVGNTREWAVRYRGRLLSEDTVAAYDQLANAVRAFNLTPLFRKGDDGGQVIFLAQNLAESRVNGRILVNVILFILTIVSMLLTGVEIPPGAVPVDGSFPLSYLLLNVLSGCPFALSMMGILFAHEMGHYIACRIYKIPATLPYFLPAPIISPLGTLGAFIAMRGIPKNKRILFDVGVAGPIAGLIIAIPVLFIGLSLSSLGPIEHAPAGMSGILEGNSIFYLFAKYLKFGRLLPQPMDTGGLSQGMYWIRYFLSGAPVPFGGLDVQLHSVGLAGWAGLLVTALNLVPVGTLDGGHVAYGLFGAKARKIFPFAVGALIVLSVLPPLLTLSLESFNSSWILWMILLFWLGKVHTTPLDDITELDAPRRVIGYAMLVAFILLFTPIPMIAY